jgi:hypothetical protein
MHMVARRDISGRFADELAELEDRSTCRDVLSGDFVPR